MNRFIHIFTVCTAASLMACGTHHATIEEESSMLAYATETLDSLYAHFSLCGTQLLRENFPDDTNYQATYLASDAQQTNKYSYLWPFSGTLSAASALYETTGNFKYKEVFDSCGIKGLEQYRDEKRTPVAYASYINSAAPSDRFYDDNVWIGIDMVDMYQATKQSDYLEKAQMVWRFIESGTDDVLGGGIYWCEQKKHSKNTCSNAPGSVLALKLFLATADSTYLEAGKKLYHWTRHTLQDSIDGLYFDNINLNGEISKAKYAYNSGQMIQGAALLYQITNDSCYLLEAQRVAKSTHKHFFSRKAKDTHGEFPLLEGHDIWFADVMLRGFLELYAIDYNSEYLDTFKRNLVYAWEHARDSSTGLFHADWSGEKKDAKHWLLTQAAMVEMYARIAALEL